jgi:hypothetical protein
MTEDFKKKILESIKKGGFASELRVSEIFNSRDWLTLNNYIYFDKEKKVNREIDILCIKNCSQNEFSKLELKISLVIEVKKSEKPWVFFMSKNEPTTLEHSFFSLSTYRNISYLTVETLYNNYPRQKINKVSTSHTEAFREEGISNIYKAIDSAVKATYYFHNVDELSRKNINREDDFASELFEPIDKEKPSKLHIFIPVIVFEGFLIEASLDSKSELQIQEGNYIPYESYYIDDSGIEHSYAVDIIKLEYLNEYLLEIENWLEQRGVDLLKFRLP